MSAGKHGSAEWTISYDDGPGGTLRAITPYVTSIDGIKITQAQQVITAFGDAWKKIAMTGVGEIANIKIHGFFDDTATVGPHVVFLTPDSDPNGATRTLTVVVSNTSKTFTGETRLISYEVLGKNGNLTEYEAEIAFHGQPTGWA
jgi:hypothetical protein